MIKGNDIFQVTTGDTKKPYILSLDDLAKFIIAKMPKPLILKETKEEKSQGIIQPRTYKTKKAK